MLAVGGSGCVSSFAQLTGPPLSSYYSVIFLSSSLVASLAVYLQYVLLSSFDAKRS